MKTINRRWRVLIAGVIGAFALVFTTAGACDTATDQDRKTVDEQQKVYNQKQPVPVYDFSSERDIAIQLYNQRNDVRSTWAVVTATATGEALWSCPSRGYPIPYDVQLTNPLQEKANGAVIEQAEPNGLYSSKNSDATWVLCVRANGDVVAIYVEQKVLTFPFAVKVVDGQIVEDTSAPTTGGTIKLKN